MKRIEVRGTIVDDEDKWVYDLFGIPCTSPNSIADALGNDDEEATIVVNSGGGDVFAGNEIQYIISQYKGTTTADIAGIAASIATVICCGADKVRIVPSGQYMIHNVSSSASGDYRDMEKASEILRVANQSIANTYRLKTGMTEQALLDLMDQEKWMDAKEALKYGFVDEVIGDEGAPLYNAGAAVILPREVIEKYKNDVGKPAKDKQRAFCINQKIRIERMRGKML